MNARTVLLLLLLFVLAVWTAPGGRVRTAASASMRFVLGAVFVLVAVRLGLAVAIIGFDLSPASLVIPASFGIAAWRWRPGRNCTDSAEQPQRQQAL